MYAESSTIRKVLSGMWKSGEGSSKTCQSETDAKQKLRADSGWIKRSQTPAVKEKM